MECEKKKHIILVSFLYRNLIFKMEINYTFQLRSDQQEWAYCLSSSLNRGLFLHFWIQIDWKFESRWDYYRTHTIGRIKKTTNNNTSITFESMFNYRENMRPYIKNGHKRVFWI